MLHTGRAVQLGPLLIMSADQAAQSCFHMKRSCQGLCNNNRLPGDIAKQRCLADDNKMESDTVPVKNGGVQYIYINIYMLLYDLQYFTRRAVITLAHRHKKT